jgi:hypothetical protein
MREWNVKRRAQSPRENISGQAGVTVPLNCLERVVCAGRGGASYSEIAALERLS